MSQLVLFASLFPVIIRALGNTWKRVDAPTGRPDADPVWALDRCPRSAGKLQRNKAGDLVVNQFAYRIVRHPHQAPDGSWQVDRCKCGWTVDYCWAVAPIWEPYIDGPFATPQAAAEAFAAKGPRSGVERLARTEAN